MTGRQKIERGFEWGKNEKNIMVKANQKNDIS